MTELSDEVSPALRAFLGDADEPDEAWESADPLAVRPLFIAEGMLGQHGSRLVGEGGVRFLRVKRYELTPDDLPPMARRRPELAAVRLQALRFVFMIDPLPAGRRYAEVSVNVTLQPAAPVFLLDPELEVTRSGPHTATTELAVDVVRTVRAAFRSRRDRNEPQPTATAFDRGHAGFGWLYQAQDDAPLLARRTETLAVLELPPALDVLAGTFDAGAVIVRRLTGMHKVATPTGPPVPFTISLADPA